MITNDIKILTQVYHDKIYDKTDMYMLAKLQIGRGFKETTLL